MLYVHTVANLCIQYCIGNANENDPLHINLYSLGPLLAPLRRRGDTANDLLLTRETTARILITTRNVPKEERERRSNHSSGHIYRKRESIHTAFSQNCFPTINFELRETRKIRDSSQRVFLRMTKANMHASPKERPGELCDKKTGWRSRGWTPLKYPKSAIFRRADEESFAYFPLHKDVLLASIRELLVLDGTLHGNTLKISEKKTQLFVNGQPVTVPCFKRHMEPVSCSLSSEEEDEQTTEGSRKRRKKQVERKKKTKREDASFESKEHFGPKAVNIPSKEEVTERLPSAEEIASAILLRSRLAGSIDAVTRHDPDQSFEQIVRIRKVSEADQHANYGQVSPPRETSPLHIEREVSVNESQEIAEVVDLNRRNTDGSFVMRCSGGEVSDMLHASISNEALLRDAAMSMTQHLVATFPDRALRLFLGYKTPAIARNRLTQLMAGFLFDTSHATFAWEQTEREILSCSPQTPCLDSMVKKSLFDERALKKIGGFDPSSLLPHAISIARLRRRNASWEFFATTAQGKRMLSHHNREESIISVGKQRRGQRLRQRYWLTSSLLWQENECEASVCTGPRSRSCSFGSSEGEEDHTLSSGGKINDSTRQSSILADMPGSRAISMVKSPPNTSWGVCLAKEGNACVVGRTKELPIGSRADQYVRRGDLVLHAQNEHGNEVFSPLCVWSDAHSKEEDWFRAMVELFKTSEELRLVVQRV